MKSFLETCPQLLQGTILALNVTIVENILTKSNSELVLGNENRISKPTRGYVLGFFIAIGVSVHSIDRERASGSEHSETLSLVNKTSWSWSWPCSL
jgi:hypothetical protein